MGYLLAGYIRYAAIAAAFMVLFACSRPGTARAQTSNEDVESLDQRLRVLERLREVDEENARARPEPPSVVAGRDGFAIRSANGDHVLRVKGLIHADFRKIVDDNALFIDTFNVRRARPSIEGTIDKYIDFRLLPDFGNAQVVLQDAYLEFKFNDAFRVRAGKTKAPFGIERLVSASDLPFVERAFPTSIAPNRDIGVGLRGEPRGGAVDWAFAVMNGVPDGGSADADNNDGKDLVARVFILPTGKRTREYETEAGLGIAASWGVQRAPITAPALPAYRTPGQATFFSYQTDGSASSPPTAAGTVVPSGDRWRISPQARAASGRGWALLEYALSEQHVKRDTTGADLTHSAWQVAAGWVVTGEGAAFPRSVRPKKPFDPAKGQWGALELVARWNELDVDDDAFPLYANPSRSASRARGWAVGLNAYLTDHSKWVINWEQTTFEGGASDGADRRTEKLFLARFQLAI